MVKKCIALFFLLSFFSMAHAHDPDIDIAFPRDVEVEKQEVRQVIAEAEPIIENLLTAIRRTNYDRYVQDFTVALKNSHWDKKRFRRNNRDRIKRVGRPGEPTIRKAEKQHPFYVLYYDVDFSKSEAPVGIRMVLRRDEEENLRISFLTYLMPDREK